MEETKKILTESDIRISQKEFDAFLSTQKYNEILYQDFPNKVKSFVKRQYSKKIPNLDFENKPLVFNKTTSYILKHINEDIAASNEITCSDILKLYIKIDAEAIEIEALSRLANKLKNYYYQTKYNYTGQNASLKAEIFKKDEIIKNRDEYIVGLEKEIDRLNIIIDKLLKLSSYESSSIDKTSSFGDYKSRVPKLMPYEPFMDSSLYKTNEDLFEVPYKDINEHMSNMDDATEPVMENIEDVDEMDGGEQSSEPPTTEEAAETIRRGSGRKYYTAEQRAMIRKQYAIRNRKIITDQDDDV